MVDIETVPYTHLDVYKRQAQHGPQNPDQPSQPSPARKDDVSQPTSPQEAPPPGDHPNREYADVIVVGAGPGGSATAAHLAMAGLDVVLLEKARFPRDKICGDGLTPRAVRELAQLGVPTPEQDGWTRTKGLRIVGGGHRFQLDWPETDHFPPYGLVRKRVELDEILARYAVAKGARLVEGLSLIHI